MSLGLNDLTAEGIGNREVTDALLSAVTLDFVTTTTTYSGTAVIDLGPLNAKGIRPGNHEVRVSVPDVAVGNLANAATIDVSVLADSEGTTTGIDASSLIIAGNVIKLIGAGGVGDTGKYARVMLPPDCPRYIGMSVASSADSSAVGTPEATMCLKF